MSVEQAISVAEAALGGTYNNATPKLEYLVKQDKSVVLTHVVEIQDEADITWYEAFVDAHSGELVSVVDFVADATASSITSQKSSDLFQLVPCSAHRQTGSHWRFRGPRRTSRSLGVTMGMAQF